MASELEEVLEMARACDGPPFDLAELMPLCGRLERMLVSKLEHHDRWSQYDWLDGFVPKLVERKAEILTLRGEEWVNAVRAEPLDVEIDLQAGRVLFRFVDAGGPAHGNRKFHERHWGYEFLVEARGPG